MDELMEHVQMMSALMERFFDTPDINLLASAIGHVEAVIAKSSYVGVQRVLLQMLEMKYKLGGELGDLNQAISISQQIAASTVRDDLDRADILNDLCNLDAAILAGGEAAHSMPTDYPLRARLLNNLGNWFQRRFDRLGTQEDLERAIRVGKETVAVTSLYCPRQGTIWSNLGVAFFSRFDLLGAVADIMQAIVAIEEAAAITPSDHSDRLEILSMMGQWL